MSKHIGDSRGGLTVNTLDSGASRKSRKQGQTTLLCSIFRPDQILLQQIIAKKKQKKKKQKKERKKGRKRKNLEIPRRMSLQPQDFEVGYREITKTVLLYSLIEKQHSSFRNLPLLIQLRRGPELEHFDPGL